MASEPVPVTAAELGLPDRFAMPQRMDYGIGMIAFGGVARGGHAPAYRDAGLKMAAVADPDAEARRVAQQDFGVPRVYEDYRDLIADDTVEVVELLTQPTLRLEAVQAAAAAGKPIITEKPFARTADECLRMVQTAERAGIPLAVHQNYRWMPNNFMAHQIVKAGLIGEPFYASIEIFGTQDVHLADHPFYARCDDFLTIQWNNHLADLLRYWTGRDAGKVMARTSRMSGQHFVSDNLLCVLADFGPGLTGHIVHHELLRSEFPSQPCRIDGDRGSLMFGMWDGPLTLVSSRLGPEPRVLDAYSLNLPHSFAGSMSDFLSAIEEGREPAVSGRRNLATIRTILAEQESARSGGAWVPVEPEDG